MGVDGAEGYDKFLCNLTVGPACRNLEGFADFSNCFSGPFVPRDPGCELHDLDADLDVDVDDYAIFFFESDTP